jgi:tRNA nucleotidyltransferase (CCA-adding enzyme)
VDRLDPPPAVREIVARLERAGHETWCVGGAVRDALLGLEHLDWDLATSATPPEVQKVFRRTVPIGVQFGTVGVLDQGGILHEVTTFRHDVKTDGRHAVVEFGASLDEDLGRRDFTINAIAYHPQREELRDPFEGRLDLERGLVRAVGVAGERMKEDRLRALRAIRFASRFSFHIEPVTWLAVKDSAPHLGRLSPERVRQELEKTMVQVERPSIALEWWRECGALRTLIPLLAEAPEDRFAALDWLPREGESPAHGATITRLAMLFFGDRESDAAGAARALRFSNADAAWIARLAGARHDLAVPLDAAAAASAEATAAAEGADDALIRRWVARVGRTRTEAFFRLNVALWSSRVGKVTGDRIAQRAATIAYRDPVELADLAVDGDDLRAAGIPAGPRLGVVLAALLDAVLTDPKRNTVSALLDLAKQHA